MPPIPNAASLSDVIIIGAGMTGLTLAQTLSKIGVKVILIDRFPLSQKSNDRRASAISRGSAAILNRYGLWHELASQAGPIQRIRITENHSPHVLDFNQELVEDLPLGYMIENGIFLEIMIKNLKNNPLVTFIEAPVLETLKVTEHRVFLSTPSLELEASLLIAADGKMSEIRSKLGIPFIQESYQQTAFVCTIQHEYSHHYTAIEHFFPEGPFAILPLRSEHHSSIVWTETEERASAIQQLSPEHFLQLLSQKFGAWLGKLQIESKWQSYPLTMQSASNYYGLRSVLVGDAAHSIHPIAGQGFNIGIRDIATITQLIQEQRQLGGDIGSMALLQRYEALRKPDANSMMALTHLCNQYFSNNIPLLSQLRKYGLSVVQQLPLLQKYLMKFAMGVTIFHHPLFSTDAIDSALVDFPINKQE